MSFLEECWISCPYCGETMSILVDPTNEEPDYIEDCQVCCRPIIINQLSANDGSITIVTRREDD